MKGRLSEYWEISCNLIYPPIISDEELPDPLTPPFCEQCGAYFPGSLPCAYVCSNCQDRSWALNFARATFPMKGRVREFILAFKYRGDFFHLKQLVDWLEDGFVRHCRVTEWDALVPVPIHHLRRRERGFNQAEELARMLGSRQKVPVLNCLGRRFATSKQSLLSRAGRLRNLAGVFELKSRFDVTAKSLLIIDDVFTTGATAEACARVLKDSQAYRVAVLTIARA